MEQLKEMEEAEKFFEKNPKTLQLLLEWEESNLKKLQAKIGEISQEDLEEFSINKDELVPMVIGAFAMSPRFMFEFLDEKDIIVEIRKHNLGFFYSINGQAMDGAFYDPRVEAEKVAFKDAITKLENQLT